MSLPKSFTTPYEYFQKANEFLKQYSWIYKEANTNFLEAGILNQMSKEDKDYFQNVHTEELNQFPYIHEPLKNLKVESLRKFRHKLAQLIPPESYKEPKDMEKLIKLENLKKMNIKKQHEIQRLAAKVRDTLKFQGKDDNEEKILLIDFGSGLGYLSELLYKLNKNVLILGLEADTYRVEAAEKRIKTYMPNASNSIQYRQQFITENSKDFIVQTAEEVFKLNYQPVLQQTTTKMVIIGLHACADLTITSMKLFLQMPQIQKLIIMPCCYHKLEVMEDKEEVESANLKFKNFPLSKSLKQVLLHENDKANDNVNYVETNEHFSQYLNRPFLRLACQQTLKRWSKCSASEHQRHGNEMFLRAVAESLKLLEKEMELVVIKRKEEKIDLSTISVEQLNNFEIFSRLYGLKRKDTNEFVDWSEKHRMKFLEIMEKYPNGGKLAEGLTCLQTAMQKLCENLVLYDRLCYMEEMALELDLKINVHYEKIMDEELSPRCYVLIAEKL